MLIHIDHTFNAKTFIYAPGKDHEQVIEILMDRQRWTR